MGDLEQYMGTIDGNTAARSLIEYNRALQDPVMKEQLQRFFATGKASASPSTSDDTDDEFLSDEQKEIRELRAELAAVNQRLAGTELSSATHTLKEHVEKVVGDYYLTPELAKEAKTNLERTINHYKNDGERGQAAIRNLLSPSGFEIVKSLMIPPLDPDALLDCRQNRDRRKKAGLDALATDSRPGAASTGREPPPDFSTMVDGTIKGALWAEANPDGHDST
jgi:hypothetical protein